MTATANLVIPVSFPYRKYEGVTTAWSFPDVAIFDSRSLANCYYAFIHMTDRSVTRHCEKNNQSLTLFIVPAQSVVPIQTIVTL